MNKIQMNWQTDRARNFGGTNPRGPARASAIEALVHTKVNTVPWKIQAKTEILGLIALLKP